MTAIDRIDLDLGDFARLDELLDDTRPELIVNAAAYTDVDGAETDREAALAEREGAGAISQMGAPPRRIYHSLFDRLRIRRSRHWPDENAECMPLNVYGESKLAGDMAVPSTGGSMLCGCAYELALQRRR